MLGYKKMTPDKVQELRHGLYRIYWKEDCGGGCSLAAVGSRANGQRWFAPTNWISMGTTDWSNVDKVELICDKTTKELK